MDSVGFITSQGNSLTQAQIASLQKSEEYLRKNKIMELFEDLLAKIIAERPEDLRDFLAKEVRKIKLNPKSTYFTHKDFDALFENYNVLGNSVLPLTSLLQGLEAIGIRAEPKTLIAKYSKLKGKTEVNKTEFIDVLMTEYNEKLEVQKK